MSLAQGVKVEGWMGVLRDTSFTSRVEVTRPWRTKGSRQIALYAS